MAVAELTPDVEKVITADDLLALSGAGEPYELVAGALIEMTPPGGTHGRTSLTIGWLIRNFVKEKQLGEVMVESGYRLTSNPDTVRSPDVSFLSAARIPETGLPDGFIDGAPDLAVEVVSPHDAAAAVQAKVVDYLQHGTALVWVVYPQQQLVVVFLPDGTAHTHGVDDTLSGSPVLPDFSCSVSEIFN